MPRYPEKIFDDDDDDDDDDASTKCAQIMHDIPFSKLRWKGLIVSSLNKKVERVSLARAQDSKMVKEGRKNIDDGPFILKKYLHNEHEDINIDNEISENDSEIERLVKNQLLLRKLSVHSNISRLLQVYKSGTCVSLLFEDAGFSLMSKNSDGRYSAYIPEHPLSTSKDVILCFTEFGAKIVFRQILDAVSFLQKHRMCHSDIKPTNVMISHLRCDMVQLLSWDKIGSCWNPSPLTSESFSADFESSNPYVLPVVKLIDFEGLKVVTEEELVNNSDTTQAFLPPESVHTLETNGFARDIWAAGCVLFIMLTGHHPFLRDGYTLIHYFCDMAMKKCPSLNFSKFSYLSESVKNFLCNMLVEGEKRLSIGELVKQAWLSDSDHNTTAR